MGASDFLKAVNAYAREYILYLIRVFSLRYDTVNEHIEDPDSPIILHTLISLVAGVLLQQIIILGLGQDTQAKIDDAGLLRIFANEFGLWVFLAILVYAMARAMRQKPRFTTALSLGLRVLAPAFFLSAAASLYVSKLAYGLFTPSKSAACTPWMAAVGDAMIDWVLVGCVLFVGLAQATKISAPVIPRTMKGGRILATAVVVFFIIFLHVVSFDGEKLVTTLSGCFAVQPAGKDGTIKQTAKQTIRRTEGRNGANIQTAKQTTLLGNADRGGGPRDTGQGQ